MAKAADEAAVPSRRPFWLSACWALEFMVLEHAAPSIDSAVGHEQALARWLNRWNTETGAAQLADDKVQRGVAEQLCTLADHLRASDPVLALQARRKLVDWRASGLYDQLALLSVRDERWMRGNRARSVMERVNAREAFWPSVEEWSVAGR